jgi:Ras-related protein Rab-5C
MPHKVVVVGESGIGKTTFVELLHRGVFNRNISSTVGATFCTYFHVDTRIKFDIWDTAGQERYASLVPMYLRKCHVVLLMYDVSQSNSLNRLISYWYPFIQRHVDSDPIYVIVETKMDLATFETEPTTRQAQEFARTHGIAFAQTSAYLGVGIHKLFDSLAKELRQKTPQVQPPSGLVKFDLGPEPEDWTQKMWSWFKCGK